MFICECLLSGQRRRVVIDRAITWVTALNDEQTQVGLRDGVVLRALAPYKQVRDELRATRQRIFLVVD
jgi:hypothetical protein